MSNDEAVNYEEVLNTAWDEIPEVKLLPVGSWRLRCRGCTHQKPKEAGKSSQVVFAYEAVEPMDDVSDDELAVLGPDYPFAENRIYARFWFDTIADKHAVRLHLMKHGLDLEGLSLAESFKAVKGKDIVGAVGTETYKEKTQNIVKAFSEFEE